MFSRTISFSVLVFLFVLIENITAQTKSPLSSSKLRSDPNIAKVIEQFKRISAKKSKDELRMIASVGLISGALEAMKNMEEHLTLMVSDLILNSDMSDTQKIMPKLDKIENTLERDLRAVQILANALDLARGNITKAQYRNRVKEIAQEYHKYAKDIKLKTVNSNNNPRERLENLKVKILQHMDMMHRELGSRTNDTIKHLETMQKLQQQKRKRNRITQRQQKQRKIPRNVTEIRDARFKSRPRVASFQTNVTRNNDRILKEILLDSTDKNVIQRKQDIGNEFRINEPRNKNKGTKLAPLKDDDEDYDEEYSDEDYDDENGGGGGGGGLLSGGLAGLITSLSGGEEGSDFGAIFGALAGVVSRLFGPGGLDIPSLIGSGTALISGLLAGDKNFGTVLGEYIGVTLDGLSGGGGAINNGQFLGNFLGTTLAKLSADPQDEDLPPQPLIFLKNFLESFVKSKKGGGESEDDEENGDAENNDNDQGHHHHGSNSFGFIAHVVKAVVGGVTSFVLNSSLGLSGGSSQGSASLSGSSHDKGHSAGIEHPKFHH